MTQQYELPFRGYVRDGARELGAEMRAEQWLSIGHADRDHLLWMHEHSSRSVSVEGPVPRETAKYSCRSIPALPDEPADPTTEGYLVFCREHDELGNPTNGSAFWLPSFGDAVRKARAIRTSILAEDPRAETAVQLTLDDALAGGMR